MNTKYLFINTIGCQMNVYDTQRIISGLQGIGYHHTSLIEKADLIIVNTCSIREKAEQKAFSFLGRLASLKKENPKLIIGVGGCVAQQEGKAILKRVPFVNIVFGTHAVGRLPIKIAEIEKQNIQIVDVEIATTIEPIEPAITKGTNSQVSGFVTIMRGCDNFCTYCIVPYVRGRETSRTPEEILNELRAYAASGMREITLLGQNVNSYGKKESLCSFPELLEQVNKIDGISRIRFVTSHPKDISDELIQSFKSLDKLCHHIHLPVQSGSNKILKKMNRKYTRELYLERIEKLRAACPDIAITSDMIVGFPGETIADFQDTLNLMKTVEFDGLFAFTYSDRPHAPAVNFSEKVNEIDKKDRLQQLLNLQEKYTRAKNETLVGNIESVLVEGLSKKQPEAKSQTTVKEHQWTGRTSTNKIVNFIWKENPLPDHAMTPGEIIEIKIIKALSHSLWGEPVHPRISSQGIKGDNYAV
jgi:tRNA-2-methylthio-N6-dimethylallyladenosine synthase